MLGFNTFLKNFHENAMWTFKEKKWQSFEGQVSGNGISCMGRQAEHNFFATFLTSHATFRAVPISVSYAFRSILRNQLKCKYFVIVIANQCCANMSKSMLSWCSFQTLKELSICDTRMCAYLSCYRRNLPY